MRKTENKNLSEFIRAINADADRACEKIKNESIKEKRDKLNAAAKQFESESNEKINKAEKTLVGESNKAITSLENKLRDELIQKRESIQRDVFLKVAAKLNSFANTGGYKEFLLKSASEIGKAIKGDGLVIFMRSEDIAFSDEIKKAVGKECTVCSDDTIVYGGLKASTDIQAADDTLDCRLESEREWFVNNSELKIV